MESVFLMLSGDCVMGEPHGMDGWGKKCSCATSHGASRKMIHQPWPLFFVPETKEMNTEVQRWAHAGGHRKDVLAWSFSGELGTHVCSSQIGSRWQVTLTSSSKSSSGKQCVYWAPLRAQVRVCSRSTGDLQAASSQGPIPSWMMPRISWGP